MSINPTNVGPQPVSEIVSLGPTLSVIPPQDGAGGALVIGYFNVVTGDEHRLRVHIAPYDYQHGDLAHAFDYAYQTDGGGTLETDVGHTAVNLIDAIKPFYSAQWYFGIDALYRNDSDGWRQQLPTPILGLEQGTGPGDFDLTNDDAARFIATMVTLKTGEGGRFRMALFAAGKRSLGRPSRIFGTADTVNVGQIAISGGYTLDDQKLVAYLCGGLPLDGQDRGTQIVAHDGSGLIPQGNEILTPFRRLRRDMKFVRGPRAVA